MPPLYRKIFGWICSCEHVNYGTDICYKCNTFRSKRYLNNNMKANDWNCKKCGFLIFGYKTHCFRCNVDKDGINIVTMNNVSNHNDEKETCCICLDNPCDVILVHGIDAHQVSCKECTTKIMMKEKKCPMCRKEITTFIKVYK